MATTREVLRITKETTPGVRKTSPTGSDICYIRLDKGGGNYPNRPTPIMWTVRGAEGNNRRVQTGSAQVKTDFTLTSLLYYSQAKILLPWACTPNTGPPENMPTVTIDHLMVLDAASSPAIVRGSVLGATVADFEMSANNNGQGVLFECKFSGFHMGIETTQDNTTFPIPALSVYPTDQPWVFQFLSGHLTFDAARTNFRNFGLKIRNVLDVLYDESQYPQAIRMCGRDADFNAEFRYKADTDRPAYNAVTAEPASFSLVDPLGNSIAFELNAANFRQAVTDSLPLDKAFYQNISVANYLDLTAGEDLHLTITDHP